MALHLIISFTDSGSGVNWQVSYDDSNGQIIAESDVPTTDYDATESDMGVPAGSVIYDACESYASVKIRTDLHYPFAVLTRLEYSVACGWSGPLGSIIQTVNNVTVSGRVQAFRIGSAVPVGCKYYMSAYGHTLTYTAVNGDTAASVVQELIDLINTTTEPQWDEVGGAPPSGTPFYPPQAFFAISAPDTLRIRLNTGNQFTAWVEGGTPSAINFTVDVDATDETAAGLHDGAAVINTSGTAGLSYSYSLDGINFQTSNSFSGLMPGNYVVTVRGQLPDQILTKTAIFSIGAGAEEPPQDIEYPWRDLTCKFFRLVRNGVTYDISEPVKWDSVNIIGKRDKDWHGYSYQYSDGVIELEFDCAAGKEIIQGEYEEKGNDGEVLFQYGYTYKGVDYIQFPGKLNLNTYKNYPQKVTCSVERDDFNNLFQSRYETKVSMAATETLDGSTVVPPAAVEFPMHAKEIVRNYKMVNNTRQELPQELIASREYVWVFPDTSAPEINEIEDNFTYSFNFSYGYPPALDLYSFVMKYRGTYSFNLQYSFEFKFLGGSTTRAEIKNFIAFNETIIQIGPETLLVPDVTHTITVNHAEHNRFLDATARVYFYTQIRFIPDVGGLNMWLTHVSTNITATSLERADDSKCKGWWLFDTINHAIKVITDNTSELRSKFLSLKNSQQPADGPAGLVIATNGKQIRQYEVAQWPLITSAKTTLNSARAMWCLGLGFESEAGKQVVRVERVNYFYRNREILVIDECWGYYEEVAKDMLYNEVEIGYDKYQDEGFNTLDEPNTKHEMLTPIKTNKLKLVQKSEAITSGYAIEESRRQQFAATATNSFSNDDETFFISMRRTDIDKYAPEKNEAFLKVENLISPGTAYNLRWTPLRMWLNWAIWAKNGFYFKPSNEKVSTTYVAQNGEMISQFNASEPNPVGDLNKSEWQEKQHIELIDYPVEERLFKPEWVYFKAHITPDKAQLINDAMKGKRDDSKNYGYITVKDDNGDYQAGWLYELAYNFATEQADIKMLKKWDSPVQPGQVCCNYLVVNGCYIKINGNKIVV